MVGFTKSEDESSPTYGLVTCDDTNTGELCSNLADASADELAKLDNITATFPRKNINKVTFIIPEFPQLPPGTDRAGQGLALFVITHQPQGTPVAVPKIGLNFK